MQTFKETYGVEVGISSFLDLAKKWEGGEHPVKIAGKVLRGICIKVDYIPLRLLQEVFNLVRGWVQKCDGKIALGCGGGGGCSSLFR